MVIGDPFSKFGELAVPAELSDDMRLVPRKRELDVGLGGGRVVMLFRGGASAVRFGDPPDAASVRRNSTQRREND